MASAFKLFQVWAPLRKPFFEPSDSDMATFDGALPSPGFFSVQSRRGDNGVDPLLATVTFLSLLAVSSPMDISLLSSYLGVSLISVISLHIWHSLYPFVLLFVAKKNKLMSLGFDSLRP